MQMNSRSSSCVCQTDSHIKGTSHCLGGRLASRVLQRPRHAALPTAKQSRRCVSCASNGNTAEVTDSKQRFSIDLEPQAEGEYCMPGEVFLDNQSDEKSTIIRVEVKNYPGLLRVIAWVVNGLELVVQNATYVPLSEALSPGNFGGSLIKHNLALNRLKTDKNGIANNTFWVTTDGGRKLDLKRAELVAERIGDFVIYCTPNQHAVEAQEFHEGPIILTNKEHDEYSVVTVISEPGKKAFLLELASAMTGLGVTIHEAIIQVSLYDNLPCYA